MGKTLFISWCKENKYDNLLLEWDKEKNQQIGLSIDSIGKYSNKKVWWKCPVGHSYEASVVNRTKRNDGCPYCSNHRLLVGFNDLAHVSPLLSAEWDYEKNKKKHDEDISNGVTNPHPSYPSELLCGSRIKVFWKCKNGHSSYISPNGRHAKRDGTFSTCNICAMSARSSSRSKNHSQIKNLAQLVPQAIKEWMYSEHNLTPNDVSCYSQELVHWKCKKGHEFDKPVKDRIGIASGRYYLHQCSECTKHRRTSIGEQICYYYIKATFPDTINSFKIDKREIDIFIPSKKIGIEFDGSFFHKNSIIRDNQKDMIAINQGITLYRFRPKNLPDTISAKRITIDETNEGLIRGLNLFFSQIGATPPTMDIEKDYNKIMKVLSNRIGESVFQSPLIEEWDYDKNTIDPHFITVKNTKTTVWWLCPNGHPSFKSYPYNRFVLKTRCPRCSNIYSSRNRKRVLNLDTGEVFDSISDAERKYGKEGNTTISCCCRGRYSTAYGYHWEYYKDEQETVTIVDKNDM